MNKRNTSPIRSSPQFFKEIRDMKMKRILKGKEPVDKPMRTSRLTLAMTRHRLFPQMKKDIIEADLK